MSTVASVEKISKINPMFSNFPGMNKKEEPPKPVVAKTETDKDREYAPPSPEGLSASSMAIAAISDVVAALAVNPNFSSLSSHVDEERDSASKEAGRLILAITDGADAITNLGFDKSDAMKAVSHVLTEAWIKNKSPREASNQLFLYAKKIDSLAGKKGSRIIGLPDQSELIDPNQSAQKFYSTQFGVNATLGIKDEGLSNWFMNHVRRFDQKTVVDAIKTASGMMKDLPQLAFMSKDGSEIILLSSAAAMAKAIDLYQKSTRVAGEGFTTAVLGKESVYLGLAYKSIIAKGAEAVENIEVEGEIAPSEITVAQTTGSMITELSRPWLNTRIDLFNNAWGELTPEMRSNLRTSVPTKRSSAEMDAARVMAIPEVRRSIMAKNKPNIERSVANSNFLTSITRSVPLDKASSMIKLRGELIRSGFDAPSVFNIENAVNDASNAFIKPKTGSIKVGDKPIPSLKVDGSQGSSHIAWATMTSVHRKIIETAGKKTNEDSVAMIELIRQGMDAVAALSGADVSSVKSSLSLSIERVSNPSIMDSARAADRPLENNERGNL